MLISAILEWIGPVVALDPALIASPLTSDWQSLVPVYHRVLSNWAPRPSPPCPPYQHWNKRYWIEQFDGEPGFAETAIVAAVLSHHSEARWVTWSSGKPVFRTAPLVGAKKPLTGLGLNAFDTVYAEKRRLGEATVRAGKVAAKDVGGGCWDVIAWNEEMKEVCFIESKQTAETWEDAIRVSQRLWLQAALTIGLKVEAFCVFDWSLGTTGRATA